MERRGPPPRRKKLRHITHTHVLIPEIRSLSSFPPLLSLWDTRSPHLIPTRTHKTHVDDLFDLMSAPSGLPYQPRRQKSIRPNRALPAPPPEEDVEATAAFEQAQEFTSPPSPPPQSQGLPPLPSSGAARKSDSHLHPYVSALPENNEAQPPTTLTPLRAHYLKKTLVNLQLSHELNMITDPVLGANALGLLGDPFILPDAAKKEAMTRVSEVARAEGRVGDLPFMRFLFHQFLLPFPFLASAPPTFWSAKVQPFLSSFLANTGYSHQTTLSQAEQEVMESLMTKEERKEAEEKKKLWQKVEKHLALMVGVGVKLTSGEEVVRIGQSELRRLEEAQETRRQKWAEKHQPAAADGAALGMVAFEVNVVGVRLVVEKGVMRNKGHEVGTFQCVVQCMLTDHRNSSYAPGGMGLLTCSSHGAMATLSAFLTRCAQIPHLCFSPLTSLSFEWHSQTMLCLPLPQKTRRPSPLPLRRRHTGTTIPSERYTAHPQIPQPRAMRPTMKPQPCLPRRYPANVTD